MSDLEISQMEPEKHSVSNDDVIQLFCRETERLIARVNDLFDRGFTVHHFWDEPAQDYDEPQMVGPLLFWKRKPRRLME